MFLVVLKTLMSRNLIVKNKETSGWALRVGALLIVLPLVCILAVPPGFAQESPVSPTNESDTVPPAKEIHSEQPQAVVYFGDDGSAKLFDESEVKADFWSLCRYFESEQMLTYCGVASGVATLNSLGIASPIVPQIYPHRMFTQENFFTDAVLHVRRPTDVEKEGSTLDQLTAMLSLFDIEVKQYRADELTVEQTRNLIVEALRSSEQRVIVDFDRATLSQAGGGHFSPLAAWNQADDRFLMLDVARYKLPPSWVKAEVLHRAMTGIDSVSGKSRGFIVMTKKNETLERPQE